MAQKNLILNVRKKKRRWISEFINEGVVCLVFTRSATDLICYLLIGLLPVFIEEKWEEREEREEKFVWDERA